MHVFEKKWNWNLIREDGGDLCRCKRVRGKGVSGQRNCLSKVSQCRTGTVRDVVEFLGEDLCWRREMRRCDRKRGTNSGKRLILG